VEHVGPGGLRSAARPDGAGAGLARRPRRLRPDGWETLFDPAAPDARRTVGPDDPVAAIALAALVLQRSDEGLGIEDPYALDAGQLAAAGRLLTANGQLDWATDERAAAALRSGSRVIGAVPLGVAARLRAEGIELETDVPEPGTIGVSATWMITTGAQHPACMYAWMDHIISPQANAAAAQRAGLAPANRRACRLVPEHCEALRAEDEGFYERVAYRTEPHRECGDARGTVCTDAADWRALWRRVAG